MASEYDISIVGESKYQSAIRKCSEGERVGLHHEHDNPHDPHAIMVISERGETIGYIARDSWLKRVVFEEGRKLSSSYIKRIHGGTGRKRNLGVVLTITILTKKETKEAEERAQAQAQAQAEKGLGSPPQWRQDAGTALKMIAALGLLIIALVVTMSGG